MKETDLVKATESSLQVLSDMGYQIVAEEPKQRFRRSRNDKYWDNKTCQYVTIEHIGFLVEQREKELECAYKIINEYSNEIHELDKENKELLAKYDALNREYEQLEDEAEYYNEDAMSYQVLYEQQVKKNKILEQRIFELENGGK